MFTFTLQQFLTRDNFRKRWDKGEAVFLHETLYAIMQAYDAFILDADVQIGGTDQLFNIITASRKLMTNLGKRANIGIILDILPGTDGVTKMSKSLGNHIPILSKSSDMYGKVMSIPDSAMAKYYRLVTSLKPNEIDGLIEGIKTNIHHPRDVKMRLAREIVAGVYDQEETKIAEQEFVRVFRSGQVPEHMPEIIVTAGTNIIDVIVRAALVESRSEVRRLIAAGAIRFGDVIVNNSRFVVPESSGDVLRIGKQRFLRIFTTAPS